MFNGARSLRSRLIIGSVALTGVAGVAIGAASLIGVRGFLVNQLDEDVTQTAALVRSLAADELQSRINGPGLPVGTVIAITNYGGSQAVYLDRRAHADRIEDRDLEGLRRTVWADNQAAQTVVLGDFGAYRMMSVSNKGDEHVIVGLPTLAVDRTVGRIGLFVMGILVTVLGAVAFATRKVIDIAVEPLTMMRETANRIAKLPLESSDLGVTDRVAIVDPDTEVGQLGRAFNHMLDNVDEALTARRVSEAKMRQFVADASHELRTPLTAIRGYSELTRRHNMDVSDDVRHALSRIESESVRMTALVEDLLLLARLDEGRALDLTKLDVSKLVKDAVNDARVSGPEHNWKVTASRGLSVAADKHRIHQVFANILSNAQTHTPVGTTVTVKAQRIESSVVITVTDNGPGIPTEVLGHVFERFARADTSRQRATGSTGLGLAIVDGLVRAHGGTIAVASVPGNTQFTITLPAAQ